MSVVISVHKWNYQYLSPCDWFILLSIVSSKFPAFSHISGFSFSFLKIWIVSYFVYLFYIFPYLFIHWWTISASWLLWTVHSNEQWSVNNPWDLDLKYFAKIYWSEIARSYGSSIFNFFCGISMLFSIAAALFCISTNRIQRLEKCLFKSLAHF